MCDEEAVGIGEIVPDDTIIYRACTRSNFLSGNDPANKDTIEPIAFQKDGKNHKDGLSLALSAADSVSHFQKNHGAIRITVGAVHGLGRGLEVRFDTTDQTHVIIRNLPCMDREPDEKEMALIVSSELAAAAEIESNKRILVPPAAPATG